MKKKLIIHVDKNHPILIEGLKNLGYKNDEYYNSDLNTILDIVNNYNGLVIRSRFKIDKAFIDKAKNLDFIARVGSGTENIDIIYANSKNISIINAPEGNKDAVGEHALGMLLSLTKNIYRANEAIKKGIWEREKFRGHEINGKTIGIIGYGNMGKSFANKLKGFNCKVICYDIRKNISDMSSKQVTLNKLRNESEIISLHVPYDLSTKNMINNDFINKKEKYGDEISQKNFLIKNKTFGFIGFGDLAKATLPLIKPCSKYSSYLMQAFRTGWKSYRQGVKALTRLKERLIDERI